MTSYATRTSPVIRGKWVLDALLGIGALRLRRRTFRRSRKEPRDGA
jgi:hypothetical protein